jgi:hypothetical protein
MSDDLLCWRCGASLQGLPLPLGRAAECLACGAPLHVCRLCEFYEPRAANACREPIAEPVMDKERANFCGYFRPRPNAYKPRDDAPAKAARAGLDALFGGAPREGAPTQADAARQALERLFGQPDKQDRG